MPLEDPDVLDIVARQADGRPKLVIVDAGVTADDDARWSLLLDKLKSYVGYILGPDFAESFPGVAPGEVTIEVVCARPPSEQMSRLTFVAPRGDHANRIPLVYTHTP